MLAKIAVDFNKANKGVRKYWGDVTGKNVTRVENNQMDTVISLRDQRMQPFENEIGTLQSDLMSHRNNVDKWRAHLTEDLQKKNPNLSPQEIQEMVLNETNFDEMATPEIRQAKARLEGLQNKRLENPLSEEQEEVFEKELKKAMADRDFARFSTGAAGVGTAWLGANALAAKAMGGNNNMNKEASFTMTCLYK